MVAVCISYSNNRMIVPYIPKMAVGSWTAKATIVTMTFSGCAAGVMPVYLPPELE
jgi:hypothetical protein